MIRKLARYFALILAVVIVFGILFRGRIATWLQGNKAMASGTVDKSASTPSERKVLYWYDAMNPQHRYDKPGKAPDGMDLVPKYADENDASPSSSSQNQGTAKSTPKGERKVLYYYDAMNPSHTSDKPGLAPDGMQLVPKYADEDAGMANMPAGTVKIAEGKQQLIGVQIATVQRERLFRTIRAVGQITADETKLAHIHLKVTGWIDRVYVDFIGQLVKKGQPLFTLYSPDLVSTEQEYLIARRGKQYLGNSSFPEASQGADSLLRSARERLRLWDISDDQIKKLDETGEVTRTLTFYSPIDGFVLDRKAFPQTNVTPDMELYTVADLSTIWATAEIYEYEVPYVHVGQQAEMEVSYVTGKTYSGRLTYISPTLDPQTRTVKVRLEFPNPKFELKPQMFSEVLLKIDYGSQIVVPPDAILDSGEKQTVFVALPNGYFEPREIKIGAKLEDKVIVLSGLKAGESIVTSGNFLIDSESRLKSAMGGMTH
ncbi:MAG: efflux RND transporter periplasmic adaptor subunit [Nitrospirales bacterium]